MIAQITRDGFGFKVWKAGIAVGINTMKIPAWMPMRLRDKWFKKPLLFKIRTKDALELMPNLFNIVGHNGHAMCEISIGHAKPPIGDMQ